VLRFGPLAKGETASASVNRRCASGHEHPVERSGPVDRDFDRDLALAGVSGQQHRHLSDSSLVLAD
jgi:hypothetical protein